MKDKKLQKKIAQIEATLDAILKLLNKSVYFDEVDMDDEDPFFRAILVKRKKYPWE